MAKLGSRNQPQRLVRCKLDASPTRSVGATTQNVIELFRFLQQRRVGGITDALCFCSEIVDAEYQFITVDVGSTVDKEFRVDIVNDLRGIGMEGGM